MPSWPPSALARTRAFFSERIWDERVDALPWPKAVLYRSARIAYATARGFVDHRLTVRAAALTYFSALSIVPLLAFTFALLKGFGAYRFFIQGTVRPWVADTFAPNPALHQAIERILGFVDATDFSRLGALGLVFLLYTSISLVSSVEAALNDVFGGHGTRPLVRQLTDYVTLLVIGPILLLVAGTYSTAAQSSTVMLFLRDRLGLGAVIDLAVGLVPIAVVAVALFVMYFVLPVVRIRFTSATLGAVLAAVGWQGALVLHVQLQSGVARSNAIYSVFSAIPIFLVWMYVSWLVVLVGGEVAASHHDEQAARERLQGRRSDQALNEVLAVALGAHVARDFLAGAPRTTASQLALQLELPARLVASVLDTLVTAGLLARTVGEHEPGHVPGRDLDEIRASDLRDALRRDPRVDEVRASVERRLGPELRGVLLAAELERRRSPNDLTLRELAALADRARAAEPRGPPPRVGADAPQ